MASPELHSLHSTPASAPTVAATSTPTSPRLRSYHSVVLLPPPQSPRLKSQHAPVSATPPPVTPRLRSFHAPVSSDPDTLLPIRPDWTEPVVERLSWLTDILISWNGSEQRRSLRALPMRSFEWQFAVAEAELPHVEAILYGLANRDLDIPIWTDARVTLTALSPGDKSVSIDTADREYASGSKVALIDRGRNDDLLGVRSTFYETRTIDTVSSSQITLTRGLRNAWPRGTIVVPTATGRLVPTATWVRPTAQGATGSIRVEMASPLGGFAPGTSAYSQHRSRDVFPFRPNRDQDINETFTHPRLVVTSVGGTVDYRPRRGRPGVSMGPRFHFSGRVEIDSLRTWLQRCAGQRLAFYGSSFERDLELARAPLSTERFLLVKSVRGSLLYQRHQGVLYRNRFPSESKGLRDLEIRESQTATPFYRRVKSWTRVGDSMEQLTLDADVGVALDPTRCILSWLDLRRLDQDEVEMRWLNPELVEVDLPMRSL